MAWRAVEDKLHRLLGQLPRGRALNPFGILGERRRWVQTPLFCRSPAAQGDGWAGGYRFPTLCPQITRPKGGAYGSSPRDPFFGGKVSGYRL